MAPVTIKKKPPLPVGNSGFFMSYCCWTESEAVLKKPQGIKGMAVLE